MKTTNTAFNELEDAQARAVATETRGAYRAEKFQAGKRPMERGRTAVWQARLVLLVMINLARKFS